LFNSKAICNLDLFKAITKRTHGQTRILRIKN